MPVYEFSCPSCGVFEQMRPVMDAGAPMGLPRVRAPARRRFAVRAEGGTPVPASGAHERHGTHPARSAPAALDAAKGRRHRNGRLRPRGTGE